jgi:hypothetical protein
VPSILEENRASWCSFSQVLNMSGSTAVVALGAEDIGRARHEAARQRWRLLADALKRGAPCDNTTDSCMGVSFGLVRCSPTSEDGWFLYSAQGFEVLVCHVTSAVSPKVPKATPSMCLPSLLALGDSYEANLGKFSTTEMF